MNMLHYCEYERHLWEAVNPTALGMTRAEQTVLPLNQLSEHINTAGQSSKAEYTDLCGMLVTAWLPQ